MTKINLKYEKEKRNCNMVTSSLLNQCCFWHYCNRDPGEVVQTTQWESHACTTLLVVQAGGNSKFKSEPPGSATYELWPCHECVKTK